MNRIRMIRSLLLWLALAAACGAILPHAAHAQATISTGNIQGTITDANGGVVASAKVTITSKATGATFTAPVSSSGTYNSGSLAPGEYVVRVEAAGFNTAQLPITVEVGTSSSGSIALQVGSSGTIITVEASAVAVNTEQATIQGVVTQQQIENLPINGRNFLDLAQLEPGVQIQDGGNFDPTKKGYSSVSFGGGYGRAARIEVDGVDISDENVGTTTQNVPVSAIREFQVSQSSLDMASELSGSGTINIVTQSGTNQIHGEGFFNWRGDQVSAPIGTPPAIFDRKQYGVRLGGPIIKNKVFAFGSWERTNQALQASVPLPAPFTALSSTYNSPFKDNQFLGRLDWQISPNYKLFYRFSFEQNLNVAAFGQNTFQAFGNVDHTPVHAVGLDFATGSFTHSLRYGYTKFRNRIADAASSGGILNPAPNATLILSNTFSFCTTGGTSFCSGPSILAPQTTYQSNNQFKYDGSKTIHSHILRYGVGVNRILGSAFADFFGTAPVLEGQVLPGNQAAAATGPFAGGAGNPLNYALGTIILGNGQGCFSETPEFGLPCGGLHDTRLQAYLGDSWKVRPNFTLSYGLRYNRDTGRVDSDLPGIAALNELQPGLGNPVRQPNTNFGPNAGIAWDPWKDGKTIIRAGGGIYYENNVFNNLLFDRSIRLQQAQFNGAGILCPPNGPSALTLPDGTAVTTVNGKSIATQICGQPIGSVADDVVALQQQFQAAVAAAGPQTNANFIGTSRFESPTVSGTGPLFDPKYQSQRAIQMNIGFQRQLRPGTVFSADYLRNIGLHILEWIDVNHDGDARFLDAAGAAAAINATNAGLGCPAGPAGIDCAIGKGATILDYANNGLTSGTLGAPGGHPAGAGTVAFPGLNPTFGQVAVAHTDGRSVYNALQLTLRSELGSPMPGVKHFNAQVSYSLSRYTAPVLDTNFGAAAPDFRNPAPLAGPGGLDRTHQLSAGVTMDLPFGTKVNFITHWYTALPQNIFFATAGQSSDLFQYDFTGDGVTQLKPLPGTRLGSFGRDIKADQLNGFLQAYSENDGNQITPAGQALVDAGLFTTAQLQSLCAVTPSLAPINNCATAFPGLQLAKAPDGQVGNDAFFTFDLRLGWSIRPVRRWEQLRVEPQVAAYNLFNRQNYNAAFNLLRATLDGGPGAINDTTRFSRSANLTGLGSGIFALGAPRALEFGIKVSF